MPRVDALAEDDYYSVFWAREQLVGKRALGSRTVLNLHQLERDFRYEGATPARTRRIREPSCVLAITMKRSLPDMCRCLLRAGLLVCKASVVRMRSPRPIQQLHAAVACARRRQVAVSCLSASRKLEMMAVREWTQCRQVSQSQPMGLVCRSKL